MGCIAFKNGIDIFSSLETKPFKDIILIHIDGNLGKVEDYVFDKKLLIIVNTASFCGYTAPNYSQLVELHEKYKYKGLEILAFPCNQFYSQENRDEADIKKFTKEKFNVDFPLFSKIDVNGENTHELYRYLKKNDLYFNLGENQLKNIPWNFTKFLVKPNGEILKFFSPDFEPKDMENEIIKYLEELSN
jgi:glutathione peroxidase